jgi:hypothetical protein
MRPVTPELTAIVEKAEAGMYLSKVEALALAAALRTPADAFVEREPYVEGNASFDRCRCQACGRQWDELKGVATVAL